MKSIPLLSGLLLLFAASCTAQESADSPAASVDQPSGSPAIRWLSFEEAVALHAVEPKKLFIDVYTDWCGWCKRMDKTTFVDSAVASELGGHFYAVKLNAERKDTVRFRDQVFAFRPEYKTHELALALLNGKPGYPTFVFLNESLGMIAPVPGYRQAGDMATLLRYYRTDAYKTKSLEEYAAAAAQPE
jgi:thioredoxin-related protein